MSFVATGGVLDFSLTPRALGLYWSVEESPILPFVTTGGVLDFSLTVLGGYMSSGKSPILSIVSTIRRTEP